MTIICFNNTTLSNGSGNGSMLNGSLSAGTSSQKDKSADVVKFVIMDILVPLVCALGLVGNLLSLVVLATEKMHRTLTKMEISAHIGLIALTVSDFLFCLLVLIFTQVSFQKYYEPTDILVYFELLCDGIITIFIIFSTWLIVVMAAERYIAVCHPLRARKLISLRRTRAVIAIVFVVCLLATIPIFLERSIEEVTCYDGKVVLALRRRSRQSLNLRRILWAVFFDFVPCIALIYFNMCLIIQIHKAKKLRDGLAPTHYTFQANRPSSRDNTYRDVRKHYTDHVSTSLLKTTMHHKQVGNDFHSVQEMGGCRPKVAGGGRSVKLDCNDDQSRKCSQDRYKRLTPAGRSNYHTHHDSKSSGDSVSNSSQTPTRKLAVKRMITTNGGGSVVKKRPSDSALNSVTATLVAVVLLFLILVSPSELLKFSLSYTKSSQHEVVTYVTNFMQVLNFSLNFVLYCAVNKTFRHTLKGLACCCWLSITG